MATVYQKTYIDQVSHQSPNIYYIKWSSTKASQKACKLDNWKQNSRRHTHQFKWSYYKAYRYHLMRLWNSNTRYGLKHGVAIRPNWSEMKVITEDIYGQIMQYDVAKDSYISKERLKTTLVAFNFSYVDIDNKWYFHDNKRLNVLWELCSIFSIL